MVATKVPLKPKGPKPAEANSAVDPDSIFKETLLLQVKASNPTAKVIRTRFPPEPNGVPHIGHAKAMMINFGFARFHGGTCILRFDDTNPETESSANAAGIEEMVHWLGLTPETVTYASDNFDKLHQYAIQLIEKGRAYVCECSKELAALNRGGEKSTKRTPCEHRERPVGESLRRFKDMEEGRVAPQEAFLRFKQDLESGNPKMWDLPAYRVLTKTPHYRTGTKWKIYPTYDMAHPLCDYIEQISHSLCTTEFRTSRQSYEWLLEALELPAPRPVQREYSRLGLTHTIMSKRLINCLAVKGIRFDDPRLFTLPAIRRRGVPPEAVIQFVSSLGVTDADSTVDQTRFDSAVRKHIELEVPRLMLVLDPLKVTIENLDEGYIGEAVVPNGTKEKAMGERKLPFTKHVWIERSDFREVDSEEYLRLAPGKTVGLVKAPYAIRAMSFRKDEGGRVTEILAEAVPPDAAGEGKGKKKGRLTYIHWVAESPKHHSPMTISEVRNFGPLFQSAEPASAPGGLLGDVRDESGEIYRNAKCDIGLLDLMNKSEQVPRGEKRKRSAFAEARPAEEMAQTELATPPARAPEGVEKLKLEEGRDGAAAAETEGEKRPAWPLLAQPETLRFQAMRMGYYCLDEEADGDGLIMNRIVTLKEDSGKAA